MLTTKLATDFRQRGFSHVLGQVHGNLSRINNGARVVLGFDFNQPQAELLGNHFLNRLDGDLTGLRIDEVLQYLLRIGRRNLGADER